VGKERSPVNVSRELAHRSQDGLEVALLWEPCSNQVSIVLVDDRDGSVLAFPVAANAALDAFYHPYAYAPALGADLHDVATLAA